MTVTGSPLGPFALAVFNALKNDSTLSALATGGVHAEMPTTTEVTMPYVVIGRRTLAPEGGTVATDGQRAAVWLDVFSTYPGPSEANRILARIRVLLHRAALDVSGFVVTKFSMTCRQELVFPDPDPALDAGNVWHGVQEWTALLEELG